MWSPKNNKMEIVNMHNIISLRRDLLQQLVIRCKIHDSTKYCLGNESEQGNYKVGFSLQNINNHILIWGWTSHDHASICYHLKIQLLFLLSGSVPGDSILLCKHTEGPYKDLCQSYMMSSASHYLFVQ